MYDKLSNLVEELKVPKNQFNKFGGYKYRSCEDILEAVKPLLKKYKLALTIRDDVICIENRFYIKATATLRDIEHPELFIENTAFAREEETKKGMDGSQVTGTSSSYARKYCVNGLFLIDDTRDADTDEFTQITKEEPTQEDADNYKFTFGKNKGKTLKEVEEEDPKYIDWLLNNSNDEYMLKLIPMATGRKIISKEEINEKTKKIIELNTLLDTTNTDREDFYVYYNVKTNNDMSMEQLDDAISKLRKKLIKNENK